MFGDTRIIWKCGQVGDINLMYSTSTLRIETARG